jgi:ubiquitin-activating enzyme E1
MKDRVGQDTEHLFNEDFWNSLDGVTKNKHSNLFFRAFLPHDFIFSMFLKKLGIVS